MQECLNKGMGSTGADAYNKSVLGLGESRNKQAEIQVDLGSS